MKALVFGKDGQLGWELVRQLESAGHEVAAHGRDTCDVVVEGSIERCVEEAGADVVYNCTAYNAVDGAEEDLAAAAALNTVAVGKMAAAAQGAGAKFVTVSTDYVFGDGFEEPIPETALAEPLSAYGESKRKGELLAQAQCPESYVVRSTGLYSHRRHNFVKTMLRHGLAGRELTVVEDQVISPTWVVPLAATLVVLPQEAPAGLYHAVAHGGASWRDYARRIFELLDLEVVVTGVDQESWGAAARRPSYSVLDNMMLRKVGLDIFEPWDVALATFLEAHGAELVDELTP